MKHVIFIIILIPILSACKKQFVENPYGFIITGDSTSESVHYSGIINHLMDLPAHAGQNNCILKTIDVDDDNETDYIVKSKCQSNNFGFHRDFFVLATGFGNYVSCDTNKWIHCYEANVRIDKNLNWDSNDNFYFARIFNFGQPEYHGKWQNAVDRYAAIMKTSGTDTIYGWIRMDLFDDSKILIKDFAFRR